MKKSNNTNNGLNFVDKVDILFNSTKEGECLAISNGSSGSVPCNESRGFICEEM